jgi:predicted small lipoprotein YifL
MIRLRAVVATLVFVALAACGADGPPERPEAGQSGTASGTVTPATR